MTQLPSAAVRMGLQEKTILLSNIAVIFYRAGLSTGVEDRHIKFISPEDNYLLQKLAGSSFTKNSRLGRALNERLKTVHTRILYFYRL